MLFSNFVDLFLDSAPWLLLGLILAGLLKVFVPMAWMEKQLGGHGIKTTIKAAVFGAPLPLCSCGVIPAAVGLRRSGASKAATTSFLVSTPETGVDSVSVSYVLLGPFMAIVRPIAAIISAIVAGLLVGRDEESKTTPVDTNTVKADPSAIASKTSCCSSKNKSTPAKKTVSACGSNKASEVQLQAVEAIKVETKSSCCSTKSKVETVAVEAKSSCCATKTKTVTVETVAADNQSEEACCNSTKDMATELKQTSILSRTAKGLHYAATDLVKDTTVWLLIGLFFAALVQTYVPADFMAKWGDGILAMLVMVVISVPMYICATASTPIAAGLLLAGVSPGAVLVFMLAGPATNIATLGVVTKELGKRALFGYLGGVLGVALLSGIIVNFMVANFDIQVMPQIGEEHQLLPDWLTYASGILLFILMLKVLIEKLPAKWWSKGCCS